MNSPQFENWFAPSVATDSGEAGGGPLVVFHGTTADDIEKDGDFYFFASSQKEAARYAPREEDGAKVIPAVLRLVRPLIIETELQPAEAWDTEGALYVERARAGSHDSIITVQTSTGDKNFIVFNAEQIMRADALPDFGANPQPSFIDWFGPSVITDTGRAGGNPLVVYHGMSRPFEGDAFGEGESIPGAIFFTDSQSEASWYATGGSGKIEGRGENVMPVYLAINNPYKIYLKGELDYESGRIPAAVESAKRKGHDGLIVYGAWNGNDATGEPGMANENQYVAFHPWQIKSAIGNNGDFDVHNQDIRFSVAEAPEVVAPTSTLAFLAWFRDSQVVDEAGEPQPLFHGTGGPVDFDDPDLMVWGSVSPELANQYAELRESQGGDHFVMPMYFKAERPLDADLLPSAPSLQSFFAEAWRQAEATGRSVDTVQLTTVIQDLDKMRRVEESGPVYDKQNFWNDAHMYFSSEGRDLIRSLLRDTLGFDSIKMTEGGSMTWGVFEPTQVKSVFNNGDFDTNNQDMRFSVAEVVDVQQEHPAP